LVAHVQEGTWAEGLENGVLGKIFGSKRDEVIKEWRKLHNEELYDLYCPSTIFRAIKQRRMRCVGHVAQMGESKDAYRILVGISEERGNFPRPGSKFEDNIKRYLQEVVGGIDWFDLAQDMDRRRALVNEARNLRVPLNAGNFMTS
jgi:hypothetical protein